MALAKIKYTVYQGIGTLFIFFNQKMEYLFSKKMILFWLKPITKLINNCHDLKVMAIYFIYNTGTLNIL
jgi:hypothetical protein